MRLTDLNPKWYGAGGHGIFNADGTPATPRHGVGISFDCPCAACAKGRQSEPDSAYQYRVYIDFRNPLDGGPLWRSDGPSWQRTGDTFETLMTQPSILSDPGKGGCGWHGYIGGPSGDRPGEVVTV